MVKSKYNKLFGFTTFLLDENETEEDFQIAEQAVNEHYKLEEA